MHGRLRPAWVLYSWGHKGAEGSVELRNHPNAVPVNEHLEGQAHWKALFADSHSLQHPRVAQLRHNHVWLKEAWLL